MKAQLPKGIRTLQEGAKLLREDGFETSPKKIFRQLRQLHWLEGRMPAADAISNGLLVKAEGVFQYRSNSGGEEAYIRTGITDKGLAILEEFLLKRMQNEECRMGNEREFRLENGCDEGDGVPFQKPLRGPSTYKTSWKADVNIELGIEDGKLGF